MFRNTLAGGYESDTGKKYYRTRPLITKEEAKAIEERLKNFREEATKVLESPATRPRITIYGCFGERAGE